MMANQSSINTESLDRDIDLARIENGDRDRDEEGGEGEMTRERT